MINSTARNIPVLLRASSKQAGGLKERLFNPNRKNEHGSIDKQGMVSYQLHCCLVYADTGEHVPPVDVSRLLDSA